MDLKDTIVTADAMNCQKDTAATIIHAKGDYVLALKGNQTLFYEEVKAYFDDNVKDRLKQTPGCYFKTVEKEHWGVENQLHWQLDFTFQDDKNTSMAKTGAKNLQIKKKTVLSILRLVKESYKISMKRIRYELSLDYEKGIEHMLSMLDIENIKMVLESAGGSSSK